MAGCRRPLSCWARPNAIKLESIIHDSQLTATINLDPSRGLKDEREMSSTLMTTEAGSAAAGSEGVSEGATGNPRQGQANPVPLKANPVPESLQYVTVYDNQNKGGFAGSEPVSQPENFRCAFDLTPGAINQSESLRSAMTMRRSISTTLALALARTGPRVGLRRTGPRACILPATTIDGPSQEIVGFGGIAMAEDGTGGLVYLEARRRRRARVRRALSRKATGWRRCESTSKSPSRRAGRASAPPTTAS